MKFGLGVSGGAELARALNALSQGMRRKQLYPVLRAAGEPLRAQIAALAPRRPPAPDLADHIGISPALRIPDAAGDSARADEFQAAIAVGPTKGFFYGVFLEYGTVRMSAHAFMRPPFDAGVPEALGIIRRGLWELILAARPETTFSPGGTGTL